MSVRIWRPKQEILGILTIAVVLLEGTVVVLWRRRSQVGIVLSGLVVVGGLRRHGDDFQWLLADGPSIGSSASDADTAIQRYSKLQMADRTRQDQGGPPS